MASKEQENTPNSTLNLSSGGKLELKKKVDLGRRGAPGGAKTVTVEVKRRRTIGDAAGLKANFAQSQPVKPATGAAPVMRGKISLKSDAPVDSERDRLTDKERQARLKALQSLQNTAASSAGDEPLKIIKKAQLVEQLEEQKAAEIEKQAELAAQKSADVPEVAEDSGTDVEEAVTAVAPEKSALFTDVPLKRIVRRFEEPVVKPKPKQTAEPVAVVAAKPVKATTTAVDDDETDERGGRKAGSRKVEKDKVAAVPVAAKRLEPRRQRRITITSALDDNAEDRQRSLASVRRKREKDKAKGKTEADHQKISRDVTIPDVITVQELANRMAERVADVVKELMKMGVMATATQIIDADTAELIVSELGHTSRRVSEADVEIGLEGIEDNAADLLPRAPVVTIMGHVDHGKTSLLDALRSTDVAAKEAGGITQHIGAYQVTLPGGQKISFLDTPGHEAFTEMRSRGATVTDIVILVVAADDGIMPQTVEAISHARAAKVPIIVAINKIDKPGADVNRVKTELLNHELIVESMGGDVQSVEVSALQKTNLDKLEEAILLQAEVLELKANPNRPAEGAVVEARLDIGRGAVATVLVQRGTLRVGDIVVAGAEWGKVRTLQNERGDRLDDAAPSVPVEIVGLNGVPLAGDRMVVVANEARAREITAFRGRQKQDKAAAALGKTTMEQLFTQLGASQTMKELAVVVKTDVHGSLEAINATLQKIGSSEVKVRLLHGGVGSITESDISLAKASNALVVGFNVRANPQAREAAKRDQVDIRYYSIIYNLVDDVKAMVTGMLTPEIREVFLGYAEIRQVFNITKVGKVAGCFVTEGVIKRGCGVRLLRDNVVIHEGKLKTLKRIKDEVKEVKSGYECGMAFENYTDIKEGDQIECYESQEVARQLD